MSGVEDRIEEMESLVKENIKSNEVIPQNIQVIWETKIRPNLGIMGLEGEYKLKSTANIFNKIVE